MGGIPLPRVCGSVPTACSKAFVIFIMATVPPPSVQADDVFGAYFIRT